MNVRPRVRTHVRYVCTTCTLGLCSRPHHQSNTCTVAAQTHTRTTHEQMNERTDGRTQRPGQRTNERTTGGKMLSSGGTKCVFPVRRTTPGRTCMHAYIHTICTYVCMYVCMLAHGRRKEEVSSKQYACVHPPARVRTQSVVSEGSIKTAKHTYLLLVSA